MIPTYFRNALLVVLVVTIPLACTTLIPADATDKDKQKDKKDKDKAKDQEKYEYTEKRTYRIVHSVLSSAVTVQGNLA